MTIPYHEAHRRVGEIHKELAGLTVGQTTEAVALLDEAIHCLTNMSTHHEIMYPVKVAQLRQRQIARTPQVVENNGPEGAA